MKVECFSLNLWKRIIQYFIGKNNRRPRFPKKAIAAFLAPAKMCLQMGFCFKVPVPAIWQSCSSTVYPLYLQFNDRLLPTLSSRATNPKKSRQRQGNIGMQNTLSPYIGHCWRIVVCMYLSSASVFKPHCHLHLPCSSLWWQVVSALQVLSHWLCPQPLASGSLAPPESKQCSQGQQRPH